MASVRQFIASRVVMFILPWTGSSWMPCIAPAPEQRIRREQSSGIAHEKMAANGSKTRRVEKDGQASVGCAHGKSCYGHMLHTCSHRCRGFIPEREVMPASANDRPLIEDTLDPGNGPSTSIALRGSPGGAANIFATSAW